MKEISIESRRCELCKKEHDGSYGSGRFCSQKCARTASNIFCDKEQKSKRISKSLKSRSREEIIESCKKNIITYNKNHPNNQKRMPYTYIKVYNEKTNKFRLVSKKKICRICGSIDGDCLHPDICNYLKRCKMLNLKSFGFDDSKLGTIEIYNEIIKFQEKLRKLYINDKLSIQEIQRKYNLTDWFIVAFWLKKFNIKTRDFSEANTLAYLQGKIHGKCNNQYKSYHHKTWFGEEVYLRSSYEEDFANELDNKKIKYEVESFRIPYFSTLKQKQKVSIPDFYVPETNTLYEIKGDFTYTKQDIEDRFKEYQKLGFSKIILVLEHEQFEYPNLPEQRMEKTIDSFWN